MWLVLIPLAIVLAILMLLIGGVALVITVVDKAPWLLILIGVWLLLKAQRGAGHTRHAGDSARPRPRAAPTSAPPRLVQQQGPRPRTVARPRRELPIDVQVKVEQIRRKADVLLGYADRFPPFSKDLHLVRQTAAEYLPRTTDAYLALPGDGDPLVAATGKTVLQELRDQLQLLDSKLDEIAQDLQRQDLDRLLANRRFLEERFRLREDELRADAPRQETGAA